MSVRRAAVREADALPVEVADLPDVLPALLRLPGQLTEVEVLPFLQREGTVREDGCDSAGDCTAVRPRLQRPVGCSADVLDLEVATAVRVRGVLERGALRNGFPRLAEEDGGACCGLAVVEDKPSGDGTAGLVWGVFKPLVRPGCFLGLAPLDGILD